MNDYIHVFTDSICRRTTNVSEVIMVKVDSSHEGIINERQLGNIKFRTIGYNLLDHLEGYKSPGWAYMVCGHAFGMHHAIENSTGEYIWFSDPDIFFLNKVDQIYLDLVSKHNLDVIGVSHFNAKEQSYGYFPCIINCMIKRSILPDSEWLKEQLWIRSGMQLIENPQPLIHTPGKYLVAFPIPEFQDQYPNTAGMFDTGCNLWIWNQQRKGRWLSFYLDEWHNCFRYNRGFNKMIYPMNYKIGRYKTNFGLEENVPSADLLYHRTRSSLESGREFKKLYGELFNNQKKTRRPAKGYIIRGTNGRKL